MRLNVIMHKPMFFKTWTLKSKQITEDSIKFLSSMDIKVRVHHGSVPLYYQGRTYQFSGDSRIEIETSSKEQESMLQLKYGTDLVLLESSTVLPNSYNVTILD